MFVAEDHNGERIELLSHAIAKTLKETHTGVFCPCCHEQVVIKNGVQVPAHFAHKGNSHCLFSEPESVEHMRGKMLLVDMAIASGWQAQLEVPVRDMAQRIDVLITRGAEKIALEFQCSPLSSNHLYARTAGYAHLGMATQWFLGSRYRQGKSVAGRLKFAVLGGEDLTIRYLDVDAGQMLVDEAVTVSTWRRRTVWPKLSLPRMCGRQNAPVATALQLAKAVQLGDRHALAVQNQCYAQGLNLAGCPWPVHERLENYAGLTQREELLRVQWLLDFADRDISDHENALFWSRAVDPRKLPLVSAQRYSERFAVAFCKLLQNHGLLRRERGIWRWWQQPRWYPDVDRKIADWRQDM